MCGNRISVRFLKTRTESKRSNPKFRFLWLFSKPNLSHINSQYLSHFHNALTFFTLWTLSDSKWSWNQIFSQHHAIIQLILYSTGWVTELFSLHVFFCSLQLIYKKTESNRRFFKNRTKTEPNMKNLFRTSLVLNILESFVFELCSGQTNRQRQTDGLEHPTRADRRSWCG